MRSCGLSRVLQVRQPLPPFTHESAARKVRLAEDGWNTRRGNTPKQCLLFSNQKRVRALLCCETTLKLTDDGRGCTSASM